MMKRFLILIVGIILSTGLAGGFELANNKEKANKVIVETENVIEEIQDNEEEAIEIILENNDEVVDEEKEEENEKVVIEEIKTEVNQEKKQTPTSNVNQNNKQTSNNSNNTSVPNNTSQTKTEVNTTPQIEPVKTEQPKAETQKQEESKVVETPKQTTPVREYKVNQNYINKLRSTITTEVTNNIDQLNKYGITDVSQYQIIVDSSICTCYGGNRNGWTYENISAYNTFKSSILKGTNLKIYAVDEYYNGEYIQTLCYYGH